MREVKFRLWDLRNKYFFASYTEEMLIDIEGTNLWYQQVYYDDDTYLLDSDNFELMQYTGLKDIHGVEIYDGDIVSNEQDTYLVCLGEFTDSDDFQYPALRQTGFYIKDVGDNETYPFYSLAYEIVGNIYENNDLIEGMTE